MFRLIALLLLCSPLLFASCGDDDGGNGPGTTPFGRSCTSQAFSDAVTEAVTDLSNAATAFSNDPTTANCEAYRTAANRYLDVVEDFDQCAGINRAEYQQAVEDAREAVADISC